MEKFEQNLIERDSCYLLTKSNRHAFSELAKFKLTFNICSRLEQCQTWMFLKFGLKCSLCELFKLKNGLSLYLLWIYVWVAGFQVVYLRELHVYHQHGVWWDCIQQDGKVYSFSRILKRSTIMSPELKCSHKFDLAAQSALDSVIEDGEVSAKELQLHRILRTSFNHL